MNITIASHEKQWVYYCGQTTIIAAFEKTSQDQTLFIQQYDMLKSTRMENLEKTKKKKCNLLAKNSNHRCKNCEEREKTI